MNIANKELNNKIAGILMRHIEPIFKDGTEITLIARTPGNDEADVLVTSERDLNEITQLIQRSIGREPA